MSNFVGTSLNFITIFLSFHKMICISDHGIKCAMPKHLFATKLVSI